MDIPTITARAVASAAELEAALALVYRRYRAAGLCEEHPAGLRLLPYHLLPTTTVFVVEVGGAPVFAFTLSMVGDSPVGLPADAVFPDELAAVRAAGAVPAEITCMADDAEALPPGVGIVAVMTAAARAAFQAARLGGATRIVIAVHPRHGRVYERQFGFTRLSVGEAKDYAAVLGSPAVLYGLDLTRLTELRRAQFFGEDVPAGLLKSPGLGAAELARLSKLTTPCAGG